MRAYVYVFEHPHVCKIGTTCDPERRVYDLSRQFGRPISFRPVEIDLSSARCRVSLPRAGFFVERATHQALFEVHAFYEWFSIGAENAEIAIKQQVAWIVPLLKTRRGWNAIPDILDRNRGRGFCRQKPLEFR